MSEESIEALKAELARLDGVARVRPLVKLGQMLTMEFWRLGPGTAPALPPLNEAVEYYDEAYGHLRQGDPLRDAVAAQYGIQLASRVAAYNGSEADRDRAVSLLEEALRTPELPPALGSMARLTLGQTYMLRAMLGIQAAGMAIVQGGASTALVADADRAAACFQEVLATDQLLPDMRGAAETMLTLVEAMQSILGGLRGGVTGFDMSGMMRALATLQQFQERVRAGDIPLARGFVPPPGSSMTDIFDADGLSRLEVLDRPVMVATGPTPATTPEAAVRQARRATEVDYAGMRRDLHDLVTRLGDDGDVYRAATALLRPDVPQPKAADVDDLVALATTLVHHGRTPDPVDGGTDRFLVATGLVLRARADGAELDDPDGDQRAGAESLADALAMLPPEHPAAVAVLRCLGAFLDERDPFGDPLAGLAERLSSAASAIVDAGAEDAVVHALAGVCAAAAGHQYLIPVADVPADYPWLPQLRAAASAAEPMRAVFGQSAASDVTEALRASHVDALAVPSGDGGFLVLDVATGAIGTGWLPSQHRVVVRAGTPCLAPADAVVSYVSSTSQIITLASRASRPVADHAVFVANPRGDRESATVDAFLLRRLFYPRSVGLGRTVERVDGEGTPGEVLTHLGASLLHLGCGWSAAGLELAGPAVLDAEAIRAYGGQPGGGVAILSSAAGNGFPTLVDALVDAGFSGVIGWDRPVPAAIESLALFMLHTQLVDATMAPAAAVHSVSRWMADPERKAPLHLPANYAAALAHPRLGDPAVHAALLHWGR